MKKIFICLMVVAMVAVGGTAVLAANSADIDLTYTVNTVNSFDISATSYDFSTITPGGTSASSTGLTYGMSSNDGVAKKITGELNSDMPADVTLTVTLANPDSTNSATANSNVTLSSTAADLVTGIPADTTSVTNKGVTFTIAAGADAVAVTSDSRRVTFTLTNN